MKDKEFYPLEFLNKDKEKIQKDSYRVWEDTGKKGVIVLPTGCITGDTLIEMPRNLDKYPNGIPIKDLVKKKDFYVYTFNKKTSCLELKKCKNVWSSGVKDIYEIKTKNKTITVSENHPFLINIKESVNIKRKVGGKRKTIDKKYIEAKDLKIGDYAIIFNRSYKRWGHDGEYIKTDYNNRKRELEHRFVMKQLGYEFDKFTIVHHIDRNKYNNSIENLKTMDYKEHNRIHIYEDNRKTGKDIWPNGIHPRGMKGKKHSEKSKKMISIHTSSALLKKDYVQYRKQTEFDKNGLDIHRKKLNTSQKVKEGLSKLDKKEFSKRCIKNGGTTYEEKILSITHIGKKETYDMEVEDNHNFIANGFVVHNSGKSFLIAMALLKHRHLDKIFVIVPKIDLMNQLYDDIVKYCKIKEDTIGRIGGGYKEDNCPITIAVIDSIRNKTFSSELLCVDEVHNLNGIKNRHFFVKGSHKRIMGLTATIDKSKSLLPIIYEMTQKEAVDKKLIAPYKMVNIGVDLIGEESNKYRYYTNLIKTDMRHFNYDLASIINNAKFSNDSKQKQLAMGILRAIKARKTILANSKAKADKTLEIIDLNKNSKILVFCEFIKTADLLLRQLKKIGIVGGKFHSKMTKEDKQILFDKFKNNEINVMIAVKSLDEGTNIPDCDIALVMSGSSVARQIIQRIGRVLRLSDSKDYATIYQIYCKGTKDEDWTKKRSSYVKKAAMEIVWK